jgi:hypothetical protein
VHPEVAEALKANKAVVALESTIISHGMPYPRNIEVAERLEQIIRENGAMELQCCYSLTHSYVTHSYVTHSYVTHSYVTHSHVTHSHVTHSYVTHSHVTHSYVYYYSHVTHSPPSCIHFRSYTCYYSHYQWVSQDWSHFLGVETASPAIF